MPVKRIPAEDVVGIAVLNAATMPGANTDGTDDIIVIVPDNIPCNAGLHQVEGGNILYIVGESADVSGGIRIIANHLEGELHGDLDNRFIRVLVPPHRNIPRVNWTPGMTSWMA